MVIFEITYSKTNHFKIKYQFYHQLLFINQQPFSDCPFFCSDI